MVTRRRVLASGGVVALVGCLDGETGDPADGDATQTGGGQAAGAAESMMDAGDGSIDVTSPAWCYWAILPDVRSIPADLPAARRLEAGPRERAARGNVRAVIAGHSAGAARPTTP